MKVYILEKPGKCLDQLLDWLTENGKISEVQTFEDDIEFIDKISICDPGMCIIRAGWNELHGLRVAEMVKQISPEIKIVILSETKDYAIQAFEVGVYGYLLCTIVKKIFIYTITPRQ